MEKGRYDAQTERGRVDYSRFTSSSSVAEELAAQEAEFAALELALARAKSEGERLRATKVDEPLEEDQEEEATVQREKQNEIPSMAELFALSESSRTKYGKLECKACNADPYALRTQLITCTACAEVYHANCVGLRSIPFKGSSSSEVRNRELFIKRYFGDWHCPNCKLQSKKDEDDQPHPILTSPTRTEKKNTTRCFTCGLDPPADRSQLLACSKCQKLHHTSCLNLKRIPFSTKPADRAHRERFIRVHFDQWTCPQCTHSVKSVKQDEPSPQAKAEPCIPIAAVLAALRPRLVDRDARWASFLNQPAIHIDKSNDKPPHIDDFLLNFEDALTKLIAS